MKRALKLISALAVMALVFGIFVPSVLAANEITVTVDGTPVEFEGQGPAIVDGRTLVPVRGVFEALGFDVDWDQETQTAFLTMAVEVQTNWNRAELAFELGETMLEVAITIGSDVLIFNGEEFALDVPAQIIEGRTMLPVRAVLEAFIDEFYWDAEIPAAVFSSVQGTVRETTNPGAFWVNWDEDTQTVEIRNLMGRRDLEYVPGAVERQLAQPSEGDIIAVLHTTLGEVHMRLFPQYAPLAVENFVTHAQNGTFDGMTWHRVINDFVAQTGDPVSNTGFDGITIWGVPFGDEVSVNVRQLRGAVGMGNFGPDFNRSHFYIVQRDTLQPFNEVANRPAVADTLTPRLEQQDEIFESLGIPMSQIFPTELLEAYLELGGLPHLDFWHTVFGQVFQGMDVVDAIVLVETDDNDMPIENIYIYRIDIFTFGE